MHTDAGAVARLMRAPGATRVGLDRAASSTTVPRVPAVRLVGRGAEPRRLRHASCCRTRTAVFAATGGQPSRRARHPLRHRLRPPARVDARRRRHVCSGSTGARPIADARRRMGADLVVQGNLDPALVLAGTETALAGDRRGARRQRRPPRPHLQPRPRRATDTDPDVLARRRRSRAQERTAR